MPLLPIILATGIGGFLAFVLMRGKPVDEAPDDLSYGDHPSIPDGLSLAAGSRAAADLSGPANPAPNLLHDETLADERSRNNV